MSLVIFQAQSDAHVYLNIQIHKIFRLRMCGSRPPLSNTSTHLCAQPHSGSSTFTGKIFGVNTDHKCIFCNLEIDEELKNKEERKYAWRHVLLSLRSLEVISIIFLLHKNRDEKQLVEALCHKAGVFGFDSL